MLRASAAGPPLAAILVGVATLLTPGYDSVTTTVSRLAVPGASAAVLVEVAILLVAASCYMAATALRRGRLPLAVGGTALVFIAFVPLDPASALTTSTHRTASGVAVAGLAVAPFLLAKDYGAICWFAGAAVVAMLALAAVLLATPFDGWGLWERALLAIPLTWIVLMAFARPSTHATASAPSATVSSAGSYAPVSNVSSAKP